MSNLKDALKAAGLVGTFGQVMETGSVEEKCDSCTPGCSVCTSARGGGCTSCRTNSPGK